MNCLCATSYILPFKHVYLILRILSESFSQFNNSSYILKFQFATVVVHFYQYFHYISILFLLHVYMMSIISILFFRRLPKLYLTTMLCFCKSGGSIHFTKTRTNSWTKHILNPRNFASKRWRWKGFNILKYKRMTYWDCTFERRTP